MPYQNVPDEKTADMDSCVEQVMAKGNDKESAVAICYMSVVEGKPLEEAILSFKGLPSEPVQEPVSEAATIKAKARAAIRALDELLEQKDVPEDIRGGVKSIRETLRKTWADLATDAQTGDTRQSESEPQITPDTIEHFAESYSGVAIVEDFSPTENNPARAPLTMRVQLIRPGWGNTKDNHYYPAEVLKRDAHVFEGKKMYTTDHREGEKSERTEVSVIEAIDGFADDGAPIARVNVFDPAFAEKVRNRKAAGVLDRLECSVLGAGTAKPFELDGRKGKIVESITDAESVDWVTRAGAGGHALEIAEAQTTPEGANMADEKGTVEVTTPPVTETPAPVAEVAAQTATAPQPTRLSEVEVTGMLEAEKRLPQASRVRLAESAYINGEAVQTAITKELAYLKEVLGSGQPFGLGTPPPAPQKSMSERIAEAEKALDRVNKKYNMEV